MTGPAPSTPTDFRYPRRFEIFRLEAFGEPPYLDADEAELAWIDGHGLTVLPASTSAVGKPGWSLTISAGAFRFTVTTYSELGTPLHVATWERDGEVLRCVRLLDLFYPEGDPGHPVPYVQVPYVERAFAPTGVMTVTWAPPGFTSGVAKRPRPRKRRGEIAYADHDQRDDVRNGPVHTVRGVAMRSVPLPSFGEWASVLAASAPPELTRFGSDAVEAAKAFSEAVPGQ